MLQFVDDDGKCYLDVSYYFEIQKTWGTLKWDSNWSNLLEDFLPFTVLYLSGTIVIQVVVLSNPVSITVHMHAAW